MEALRHSAGWGTEKQRSPERGRIWKCCTRCTPSRNLGFNNKPVLMVFSRSPSCRTVLHNEIARQQVCATQGTPARKVHAQARENKVRGN
jgi:hypothetical protein